MLTIVSLFWSVSHPICPVELAWAQIGRRHRISYVCQVIAILILMATKSSKLKQTADKHVTT